MCPCVDGILGLEIPFRHMDYLTGNYRLLTQYITLFNGMIQVSVVASDYVIVSGRFVV
jgi:hypothetical protein